MIGDSGLWGGVASIWRIDHDWRKVRVLQVRDVPVSKTKCVLGCDGCARTSTPRVRVGIAKKKSEPVVIDEFYRFVPSRCGNASRDVVSWAFR